MWRDLCTSSTEELQSESDFCLRDNMASKRESSDLNYSSDEETDIQSESQESKKKFHFVDKRTDDDLIVVIPEVLDPAYGMYVWPCAPVLAQYIWFHRHNIVGKRLLELGSGTSLPGVVAAKCGAIVTLSDSASYPQCLENCKKSCEVNQVKNVDIVGITWGDFTPQFMGVIQQNIIISSDCFYDKKDFEDIVMTVSFLLEKNPGSEFWCTYQERSSNWSISHLLKKWRLLCDRIPLSSFGADSPYVAGSNLPGRHTIHMLTFTKMEGVT